MSDRFGSTACRHGTPTDRRCEVCEAPSIESADVINWLQLRKLLIGKELASSCCQEAYGLGCDAGYAYAMSKFTNLIRAVEWTLKPGREEQRRFEVLREAYKIFNKGGTDETNIELET